MTEHTTHDTPQEIPYGYCHCGCGEKTKISPKNVTRLGWKKGEPIHFVNGHNPRKPRPKHDVVILCACGCGLPAPISPCSETKRGYVLGEARRYIVGHQINVRPIRPPIERFWQNIDKHGPEECWEWTGTRDKRGYGQFRIGFEKYAAHRFSYELHNGPIPDGLWVLHSCDNPPCCNPKHLWLGTHTDNMKDMDAKGRRVTPTRQGEANASAKLTAIQVREIRDLCASGMAYGDVAIRFGVKRSTIGAIIRGQNWAHVE